MAMKELNYGYGLGMPRCPTDDANAMKEYLDAQRPMTKEQQAQLTRIPKNKTE